MTTVYRRALAAGLLASTLVLPRIRRRVDPMALQTIIPSSVPSP